MDTNLRYQGTESFIRRQISVTFSQNLLPRFIDRALSNTTTQEQNRQGVYTLTQISTRCLTRLIGRKVKDVVSDLECHTNALAELRDDRSDVIRSTRQTRTKVRGRCDQRAGLIRQNLQVEVDAVVFFSRTEGFIQLTDAETFEGLRMVANHLRTKRRDQHRRPSKKHVTSEDRTIIAPHVLSRRNATPGRR